MTWQDIPGWFNFQRLYDHVVQTAPSGAVLVEVGCWLGRSLVYLAAAAKAADKGLQVVGVEHGLGALGAVEHANYATEIRERGSCVPRLLANLRECCVDPSVLVCDSVTAASLIRDPYFVFLDADHRYGAVEADLAAWWPRVVAGGMMAGHDYDNREVYWAVWDWYEGLYRPMVLDLTSPHCRRCWSVVK